MEQTKGNICFYPLLNLMANTMKDGDWLTFNTSQINQAIELYFAN